MRVLFFAMALFVGAVVAWILAGPHKTVVHERTRTGPETVLVAPPLTPLQQRRARRSSAGRSPDSARSGISPSASSTSPKTRRPATNPTAPKSPRSTRKHKTTTTPAPAATQPQTPSAPPQTQPSPQPGVTVPLPSVCLPPVRIGTCP